MPHPHGHHGGFRRFHRGPRMGYWPGWRFWNYNRPIYVVSDDKPEEKPLTNLNDPVEWYESPLGVLGIVLVILLAFNMAKK